MILISCILNQSAVNFCFVLKEGSADTERRLPNELWLRVFDHLSFDDLREIEGVNQQWRRCARTAYSAHYRRCLEEQLQTLGNSALWQSLILIANDLDVANYVEKRLLSNVRPENRPSYQFNQFYQRLKACFPNRGEVFNSYYGKIITPAYLQEKAWFILNTVAAYHPAEADQPHDTLASFLNFPEIYQAQQAAVFQAYLEIEESFAVIHNMVALRRRLDNNNALHQMPVADRAIMDIVVGLACDPQLNRFLSGKGLTLLNNLFAPDLYRGPCLIESCINRAVADYKSSSRITHSINNVLSGMRGGSG
ncbi:MAG: hypothetical protein ACD_45C00318G0003 [uncultured bacterium]|nr:MAG: hypothetical protein ACD_45C00318G0003 [uncultured bacterium]OGT59027.1 MAG: hypothetical protein A3F43_06680 [Gammaproteobacteria bacterium RIFCSPHIGHO2_12_FULL_42_10]